MNLGALDFFTSNFSGEVGDRCVLQSGDLIEVDGVIRSGEGWCDHSRFSGESKPIALKAGDPVFAGTTLISGSSDLSVEVLKTGNETRLAKLLFKISEVQAKRTVTELRSDLWAKRLLILVSTVSIFSLIYFAHRGLIVEGIHRVLALLIVTCPCALALATPLVFTLAMKSLMKNGLLVKDPSCLDFAPDVKVVYFDKTGTLTEGNLTAHFDIKSLTPQDQSALFSLVRLSRHPASRSIEKAFWEKKVHTRILEWNHFEEVPNVGVLGELNDSYSLIRAVHSLSGDSESVFLRNGVELCHISFRDQVRSDSAPVMQKLRAMNYELSILSGDLTAPVQKLANELGITSYFSTQNPEQKAIRVSKAMMVGDGVNDALALSQARVSIAVQGGMEAAIQSAQAYSLKPGISIVPTFFSTAHLVRKTLRQNFILSTSYNFIGALLSLTGHMNPLWAAVLMPASALTVFMASFIRLREVRS